MQWLGSFFLGIRLFPLPIQQDPGPSKLEGVDWTLPLGAPPLVRLWQTVTAR